MTSSSKKPIVKVCIHKDCSRRGSERVYAQLRETCSDEADVRKTDECFRFCASGPNVAVLGAVLHGIAPHDATNRIRNEIRRPSIKKDAVGTRPLDDLDDVLGELAPLEPV